MKDKLVDWTVCGRIIGQATGWDMADTFAMQIYGLVPDAAYKGPVSDCINVDFEKGLIETYTDDGKVDQSVDMILSVADCPVNHNE